MQCHALFIHVENVQGFTELRNKQEKNKSNPNTLDRTRWRNKRKTGLAKPNQHCDVTKGNRNAQNNPILLQQLLNNGISLQTRTFRRYGLNFICILDEICAVANAARHNLYE